LSDIILEENYLQIKAHMLHLHTDFEDSDTIIMLEIYDEILLFNLSNA
jgi:hypothetical protein